MIPNPLPPRLRDVATCLYLQMYYWGRDVLHPDGNLLVEYGFRRYAKEGVHGTSRYQHAWHDGVIELHGHVAGWYRPEGEGMIFVRQRRACQLCGEAKPVVPGCYAKASIWTPRNREEWGTLANNAARVLDWLCGYEGWVLKRCGPRWRQEQFHEYRQLPNRMWWLDPGSAQKWMEAFVLDPTGVPRARRWGRGLEEAELLASKS